MDRSLIQGTPEWLEMRRSKIMASDAAVIMGYHQWNTPYNLCMEKWGCGKPVVENDRMRAGKENEPRCLQLYNDVTGNTLAPDVVFHPFIDHLGASLDGVDAEHTKAVEIKYSEYCLKLAKEGKWPEYYYPQFQQIMDCLDIDELDYFACYGAEYAVLKVRRDQEYMEKYRDLAFRFWNHHVMAMVPPTLVDKDYSERGAAWVRKAEQLQTLKATIKELEEQEKVLSKEFQEMSEHRNSIGGGFKYTCIPQPGRISYGSIPEVQEVLKDIDLKPYTGKSYTTWRLTKSE